MLVARPTRPAPKNHSQVGIPDAPVCPPVCIITLVTISIPTALRPVVTQ